MTHIRVGKLIIIGSDNGLSPGRRQAIIWTNARIWSMGPLGTNFSEISIEIHTFSFRKMHLKMSSAKWRLSCLGLNVLNVIILRKRLHIIIIIISLQCAPAPEDLFLCSYLPVVKTFAGRSQTFLFALVEVHVTPLLYTTLGEHIFIFFPCAFCNKIKYYVYFIS